MTQEASWMPVARLAAVEANSERLLALVTELNILLAPKKLNIVQLHASEKLTTA
jgi:hypothetical protein